MIIRTTAYPRAALIGNPSDGYFGKTIAFTFANFAANVTLYESPELEIVPSRRDESVFDSIGALHEDVRLFGYYGGIRLLKSAINCFYGYCREHEIDLHRRNFTIRYDTDIPNLVGLAGSSAIITATMRALLAFYGVAIPKPLLANLIRAVENRELGISAGLQDRVAQVYQGIVFMDFDKALFDAQGFGRYEPLALPRLPPLYIAYRTDLSEGSEVFHNNIRDRFERGDKDVVAAMAFWADLTVQARAALEAGDWDTLARLMNANFDKRRQLITLSAGNLRMVETARSVGASAKFTGSGGAIIGTYTDEAMFNALTAAFAAQNICVLKPDIVFP
jgi:glucuronokinase